MPTKSLNNTLETVQRILYLLALIALPLSIMPFPWDLTEFSMTLVLALFTIPILILEIFKAFLNGSISYNKGKVDFAVLLFLVVLGLSTIFSKSVVTSLLGFDSRLGGGLIGLIVLLMFAYTARSYLKTFEGVIYSLIYLLIGVSVGAVISILSFWGMNILSFIPSFNDLFTVGLPLYSSARVSLVIFGSAVVLSSSLIFYSLKKFNLGLLITTSVMFLINLLAVILFSLVQGSEVVLLLLGVFGLILVLPFFRRRPLNKTFVLVFTVTFALALSLFALFRIQEFKDVVIRDSNKLITQVTISTDIGWKVATNAVSESLMNGVVGYGLDTFSIAYNQYRPLTDEILILNNTNFTYPNNHLLTLFISMGILGVLVWAYLIVNSVLTLFKDLKDRKFLDTEDFILLMFDALVVFILLSSAFIYFTFYIYFLLFLFITLATVLRSIPSGEKSEKLVINADMIVQNDLKGGRNVIVAVSLFSLPLIWLFFLAINNVSAGRYVLKAESISANGRNLIEEKDLSEEDRQKMLVEVSNLYGKAINKAPYNDLYHRRVSLVLSQYVEILVNRYNETENESEKKELFDDITAYADIAVEEAKLATDRSPHVYANWGTRANVYSKMVGIGFKVYSKSALTTMQTAASLNPLNYELYYNAAQLYVVNNDNGSALKTLNQVFTINPEHIPSNILAGELSMNDKDYRQADRYFTNAKDIMEKYGDIDSELYKYVIKRLNEITPLLPTPEVKDNNTNTGETTQNEEDEGDSESTESN